MQGARLGRPARLVRVVRRQRHQRVEGSAAIQLLGLVGPLRARVGLLGHSRRGHGRQEPSGYRAAPAQRPRPLPGSRWQLLQLGSAIPAPHQHPSGRYQRVLVCPPARATPAIGNVQLVAH